MDYKETYKNLFGTNDYSTHQETEYRYQLVLNYLKNNNVKTLVDISSGRGVMLQLIKREFPNVKIISTDLERFHEVEVEEFREVDLSDESTQFTTPTKYDLLTCLDVLEHLDKSFINNVFKWFSEVSKNQILTIANHSEILNGVEIHTIREDMTYWGPIVNEFLELKNETSKTFIHKGKPHYLYVLNTESKIKK
tara:strand:- start:1277 stop:1858 length:582 start_codon:yes stop_codon:yes gene_type:complete